MAPPVSSIAMRGGTEMKYPPARAVKLPPDVAAPLSIVLASPNSKRAERALVEAFAAAGWAVGGPLPEARNLTPVQYALVRKLADVRMDLRQFDIPYGPCRRGWLGLALPGLLERRVTLKIGKQTSRVPLWRAIKLTEDDDRARKRVLAAMSLKDRLHAWGQVNLCAECRPFNLDADVLFPAEYEPALLKRLAHEGRGWAPGVAARLVAQHASGRPLDDGLRWPIFVALVRAKVRIEPRWDVLLPLGFGTFSKLTEECVRAIPPERRTAAIVDRLSSSLYTSEEGLPLLAKFPSAELTRAILEGMQHDRVPNEHTVAAIEKLGTRHAIVREAHARWLAEQPKARRRSVPSSPR
jgi:hypothetical protein